MTETGGSRYYPNQKTDPARKRNIAIGLLGFVLFGAAAIGSCLGGQYLAFVDPGQDTISNSVQEFRGWGPNSDILIEGTLATIAVGVAGFLLWLWRHFTRPEDG